MAEPKSEGLDDAEIVKEPVRDPEELAVTFTVREGRTLAVGVRDKVPAADAEVEPELDRAGLADD